MDTDQVVFKGLFSSGVYCRQPKLFNLRGEALVPGYRKTAPIFTSAEVRRYVQIQAS